MLNNDKTLKLSKDYTFSVSVRDEGKVFAGKLTLSSEKCTLIVMGERYLSDNFYQTTRIECSAFDKTFLLFEISLNYRSNQNLSASDADDNVWFFESEFEVGFVICNEALFNVIDNALGFIIDSDMIKKWVGFTNLQQEIVEKYSARTPSLLGTDTLEFEQELQGYGLLSMFYNFQTHCDMNAFTSGFKFPPQLFIKFNSFVAMEKLHIEYKKLYEFMTVFIGSDFKVETVKVSVDSDISLTNTSVYFPTANQKYERDYPVFPLCRNLRFQDLPIPELPIDCFNNYYLLSENDRSFFSRYLRYQRVNSEEERFLGYFRLLENLIYKTKSYVDPESLKEFLDNSKNHILNRLKDKGSAKDIKTLISRIEQLNNSKYNTAKCIIDFYAKLPSTLKERIVFNNEDIQDVCQLRNNITHANAYTIDEKKLAKYSSFINILLYIALLGKVEISPKSVAEVVHRLNRYHLVQK